MTESQTNGSEEALLLTKQFQVINVEEIQGIDTHH